MLVNVSQMSAATDIPVSVIEQCLGERPVKIKAIRNFGKELRKATTLHELSSILENIPRDRVWLIKKAQERKARMLSDIVSSATTILEWYEAYRMSNNKTRKRAKKNIEELFFAEFDCADSVEKINALYGKLPLQSRSLSYLQRKVIRKLATYFASIPN